MSKITILNFLTGQVKFSKICIFFVFILIIFSFASSAYAVEYLPIVQCGNSVNPSPCTTCDLFKMIKNVIDLILYILTPVLATFFFIWAGFLMLIAGASPGWYNKGKGIFANTVWGIVIVLLAWVVANTFIQFFGPSNIAGNWWQFACPAGLP